MKSILKCLPLAVILGLGVVSATPSHAVQDTEQKQDLPTNRFSAALKELSDKGDWEAVLSLAREWQKEVKDAPIAAPYVAEADYFYMSGDIDQAIKLYQAVLDKNLQVENITRERLEIARNVRRNFPDLKLQPLQFESGDGWGEAGKWSQKGADLLVAKKYDEIEKTAASLQQSKAASLDGDAYLHNFFTGLSSSRDDNTAALQSQIAAWRKARPNSNLARLAEIQMWTNIAADARGSGVASTITPEMSRRMSNALDKGAKVWAALPKEAFATPLAFAVALRRCQLTGASRESIDKLFRSGSTKFPDYFPLYQTQAYLLLPRWYGEPGEAEAMLKSRADKIGGAEGDIFYGRLLWYLSSFVPQLSIDTAFDYKRAQRGLKLLGEKFPKSVSVRTAQFGLAYLESDKPTLQRLLSAPEGHILDTSWWMWNDVTRQNQLRRFRMVTLGELPEYGA